MVAGELIRLLLQVVTGELIRLLLQVVAGELYRLLLQVVAGELRRGERDLGEQIRQVRHVDCLVFSNVNFKTVFRI